MRAPTLEELNALKEELLARLGLQGWTATLRFATLEELDGALGDVMVTPERMFADIRLYDPTLPNPDPLRPRDPHKDLAHEVWHIPWWHVEPEDWETVEGRLIEQCIDRQSAAFIDLWREVSGESIAATRSHLRVVG